jgi:hypothetical protein
MDKYPFRVVVYFGGSIRPITHNYEVLDTAMAQYLAYSKQAKVVGCELLVMLKRQGGRQ